MSSSTRYHYEYRLTFREMASRGPSALRQPASHQDGLPRANCPDFGWLCMSCHRSRSRRFSNKTHISHSIPFALVRPNIAA
jgi:hypothetical protein